jgi:DDE superfamily endonuclease
MQITVEVTVTTSGKLLTPFIVFKGTQGGRIEHKVSTFPTAAHYCVQSKAWMDKSIMHN